MNLIDVIREKILKFLKIDHLIDNPNNERYTFISDAENIIKSNVEAYKVWYLGDSDELLNYYTNNELYGNANEPIYNRNKRNYFWGISANETTIKRVHSGVPNAIVSTLVNVLAFPSINVDNEEINERVKKIIKENDLVNVYNQQQMPLTMVQGWGAYKINFDSSLSDVPIIEYYEAEDVEFVYKSNILIGIIYKDYYRYKNKEYVMLETRRKANGNSYIEYSLYRLGKNNEADEVAFSEVPELADYADKNVEIKNLNEILGVPCKFFYDPLNKQYGRSIFAGKIDLFDDLDQVLSQASQTCRVSTPVEYYPIDLLERNGRNGQPLMPKVYNRQFIKKEGIPNGDGNVNDGNIQTSQPNLNFDGYNLEAKSILDFILTGIISPATLGIDISKKDNAEAQREKEKVTLMTRNNIMDRESIILEKLIKLCIIVDNYIHYGYVKDSEYEISINFDEYANPSFENKLITLSNAYANGAMSAKKYVDLLWEDKLSDEEKNEEVMRIIGSDILQNVSNEDIQSDTNVLQLKQK